jgi:hypothetical protein
VWMVSGLVMAGLSDAADWRLTYVRHESVDLWNFLDNLQICSTPNCFDSANCSRTRGAWISGPPGVGKSTELFGWGMYHATRVDGLRKNMLWVHQMFPGVIQVVRVLEGVVKYSTIRSEGLQMVNAIADLCVGCSILLFDALRNEMRSLIGITYMGNRDAVIVACTSYQSGGYNTEESTRLHHFCHRYIVYSWTLDQYKEAWRCGIFGEISEDELAERFHCGGGSIRLVLKGIAESILDIEIKLDSVTNKSVLL